MSPKAKLGKNRRDRAHYARNPEKHRERKRKQYALDPKKKIEASRTYRGLPVPTRPTPELCEIGCGRKANTLDHCHATGTFRGWVCNECNLGLGKLGDTHEAIKRVDAYFVRAQSEMWLAIPGHGLPALKI